MARYTINSSRPVTNPHRFMIGPPLVIISVFCFGFVMLQPHAVSPSQSITSSSRSKPKTKAVQADLPTIFPASQADLTTLSPAPIVTDTTTVTTTAPTPTTPAAVSVNTTGHSSTTTVNPQSAIIKKPTTSTTTSSSAKLKAQVTTFINSLGL